MESRTSTLRLLAVMAAVAVFYIVGRLVAEALQGVGAEGFPGF